MKFSELLQLIKRSGSNVSYIEICCDNDWDSFDCIELTSKILYAIENKTVLGIRSYDKAIRCVLNWN